ncbi:MAG: hypothetical protein HYY04_08790 [Chloroflexi bacterium]|nr:hypothetical protein [Chloroflexota bacterium]
MTVRLRDWRRGATKAERVRAAIQHREPDVVPGQEFFMDDDAEEQFRSRFGSPRTSDWGTNAIANAEMMDNYLVHVGGGGLRSKVVERGLGYELIEYENGMKWKIYRNPYWREYVDYPIKSEQDVARVSLPDPDDPARYAGIRERATFLKRHGYFTQGGTNGIFSALWYFWVSFDTVLQWMVEKPELVHELLEKVGTFSARVAGRVAEQGADSVTWVDDLGYNQTTFFAPRHYREFIFPWHQRMAAAIHEHGAYAHMHSHGNVNSLVPQFIDAGIDMLNPVGPSDNMVLGELKARYGDRITLVGGISKYIGRMSWAEIEAHVEEVVRVGAPGGGFIVFSEGGIPRDMSDENFSLYREAHRKYRAQYGAAGHRATV